MQTRYHLHGKTINLTADEVTIDSTNFSVDSDGNLICNNAKLSASGGSNTGDSSGLNFKVTGDNNYRYSGFAPGFGIVRNGSDNYINMEARTLSDNSKVASMRISANSSEYISTSILEGLSMTTLWHTNTNNTQVSPGTITMFNSSVNARGKVMFGDDNNENIYNCNWTGSSLQFYVNGSYVGTLSDKRLKTEIEDIDEDFINAIKEVEMKQFKVDNRNGLVSFGILAQDLIEIFEKYNKNPFDYEIVQQTQYKKDDETIYYTINYEQFLILKTKAQEIEIKQLQTKDKEKDNLIQDLLKRVEKLEKGEK